jgi:hypothetical protein
LEKKDFSPDTRYTVTLREENDRLRPANIYVYRLYADFMVARMTDHDGLLRKIAYADIVRIVRAVPVAEGERFYIPDAVLAEKEWRDRTVMERYSSGPGIGK